MANIIPSGNAGLTTRINTTIKPIMNPKIHFPVCVIDAETGSVAIKNIPKAKPPKTKCQYQVKPNNGLVAEPIILNKVLVRNIPKNTPSTILQAATPVINKITPPIKIAKVLVSPIEPGI